MSLHAACLRGRREKVPVTLNWECESSTFCDYWNDDDFAISKWLFCVFARYYLLDSWLLLSLFLSHSLFIHLSIYQAESIRLWFWFAALMQRINWTAVSWIKYVAVFAGFRYLFSTISNVSESTSSGWWLLPIERKYQKKKESESKNRKIHRFCT